MSFSISWERVLQVTDPFLYSATFGGEFVKNYVVFATCGEIKGAMISLYTVKYTTVKMGTLVIRSI